MKNYVVAIYCMDDLEARCEVDYICLADIVKELNNPCGDFIHIGNLIVRKNDVTKVHLLEGRKDDDNDSF